jgi:hypothetical protein
VKLYKLTLVLTSLELNGFHNYMQVVQVSMKELELTLWLTPTGRDDIFARI